MADNTLYHKAKDELLTTGRDVMRRSTNKMPRGMVFFFSRIFPLIFIIVGGFTGFVGVRSLLRAKASSSWPTAQGVIVSSSVERHHSRDSDGHDRTTYHAEVFYEFTVDGTVYNGNKVAYGDYGSGNPSHARKIVNKYPKDKSVEVHYMPEDPGESILEPGVKAQAWFIPLFGLVFFSAGCVMALFLPRVMRKQ
jgi:hypothetical protein